MTRHALSIHPVPVKFTPRELPVTARVLVVDDEKTNVELLSRFLEQCGYSATAAFNGKEALEKVNLQIPDVVLLDIMMPVLDGLSVCRQLRQDFRTRGVPVILLTARHSLDDRLHGFQ